MARVGATAWARSPLFVAITALLLASAVGISADDDHDGVAPTLLVSLDGFRASYLDAQPEDALPNLNAMWREGVRASLYPRFISKTFPNHYSIVTGLQEEHHGIVANHMWDPRLRSEFNLASTESEWWNEGEPIWVTASRARITNKVYFWPGSEALIRKHRPDVYFKYDISVTYEERVDVVSNWVKEAHADVDVDTGKPKPAFMALYFDEPDHTGHVYGPASDEVKAAVRRVDESIGRLRMNVGEGVWNATNVVVVSDHGMAQLSSTRVVNLADGACGLNFTELFVTGDGVAAHLWRRHGPSDQFPSEVQAEDARFDPRVVAARITACHPNVTAWAKEDVPPRLRYSDNARIGPVVVAADVGWLMCGECLRLFLHLCFRMGNILVLTSCYHTGHGTFDADASGNGTFADLAAASAADPANWALRHVTDEGCAPVCDGTGYCGTHGYDNTVDEMRAGELLFSLLSYGQLV
jgi:predicted AlkP superfamily pyrophosphatase or phosphodiesterase